MRVQPGGSQGSDKIITNAPDSPHITREVLRSVLHAQSPYAPVPVVTPLAVVQRTWLRRERTSTLRRSAACRSTSALFCSTRRGPFAPSSSLSVRAHFRGTCVAPQGRFAAHTAAKGVCLPSVLRQPTAQLVGCKSPLPILECFFANRRRPPHLQPARRTSRGRLCQVVAHRLWHRQRQGVPGRPQRSGSGGVRLAATGAFHHPERGAWCLCRDHKHAMTHVILATMGSLCPRAHPP